MTLSTASIVSHGRRAVQHALVVCTVGIAFGLLTGCDAVNVHSSTSSDTPRRQSSELRIEAEALNEANLFFESGSISEGETFSIELIDDQRGEPVARITHEGVERGRKLVKTDFEQMQPTSVTMECRNRGEVLYSQETDLTSSPDEPTYSGGSEGVTTMQEPDSYHYVDNGESVLVAVDYEDDTKSNTMEERSAASVQFASSAQALQCTHIYFTLDGVSPSVSADGILFSGKTEGLRMKEKKLR